ncbi:aldo/keto reductase [Olsenella uli]|uniref:aldo/keto reductase n=1 Tax=Olsenella uli TaxID=133926 RepID=UPI0028EAE23E|nr:aldo/keto reductase [Olsenella uli]
MTHRLYVTAGGGGVSYENDSIDASNAAVKIGCRHFDAAQAYGNEREVGEGGGGGVRASGVDREKPFVTSNADVDFEISAEDLVPAPASAFCSAVPCHGGSAHGGGRPRAPILKMDARGLW